MEINSYHFTVCAVYTGTLYIVKYENCITFEKWYVFSSIGVLRNILNLIKLLFYIYKCISVAF